MTEQIKMQVEAKVLTGFEFLRHPDNPALGARRGRVAQLR